MFKNILVIMVFALAIASCKGSDQATLDQTAQGDTVGYQYNAVALNVDGTTAQEQITYTVYCSETGVFYSGLSLGGQPTSYTVKMDLGTSPSGNWKDIPFTYDGTWYCGITARSVDGGESALSGTVLGVRKDCDFYFRL